MVILFRSTGPGPLHPARFRKVRAAGEPAAAAQPGDVVYFGQPGAAGRAFLVTETGSECLSPATSAAFAAAAELEEPPRPLFVFCGPSGSGKSAIVDTLCSRHGLRTVGSYTDRARRTPEETGHEFLTPAAFEALPGKLLYTEFAGHRYCQTAAHLDGGDLIILDMRGVAEICQAYCRPIRVIGVTAPESVRLQRMLDRGDDRKTAQLRLEHDDIHFGCMLDMCHIVLNNSGKLEEAVLAAQAYIAAFSPEE